jgi:RNA-directed DNA polymerase
VGVDGIRLEGFTQPLDYCRWNPDLLCICPDLKPLEYLQDRIRHLEPPDPTEQIRIGKRTVERGTVANRIVEKAIVRKLNLTLDKYFSGSSWGYRPGRSPEQAIQVVRAAIRSGAHWLLKSDVKSFFSNVDRTLLEAKLRSGVLDEALADVIMIGVSPVLLANGRPIAVELTGLPEGNGITPFLSNMDLHELDLGLSDFLYFRYADDILVLGHSRQDVLKAKHLIKRHLDRLGLRLNPEKTFIGDVYSRPVVFLGYELRGGNIYPARRAIRRFESKLRVRGHEAGQALMEGFVRRYRIGPVRRLFRRLDKRLGQLYPPGVTLVGLLAVTRARSLTKPVRHRVRLLGNSFGQRSQS